MKSERRFDLIETMRFDPREGVADLERHLARMKGSAAELGFAFDRHHARNELQAATFALRSPRAVRLVLSPTGALAIETRPLPEPPEAPVPVRLARGDEGDVSLRHSTTGRPSPQGGAFDLLFEDAEGFLTRGSFTTLFVERGGRLITPPLSRTLCLGVLRERLIEEGRAVEANLRREDLDGGFHVGNAVYGLLPARLEA